MQVNLNRRSRGDILPVNRFSFPCASISNATVAYHSQRCAHGNTLAETPSQRRHHIWMEAMAHVRATSFVYSKQPVALPASKPRRHHFQCIHTHVGGPVCIYAGRMNRNRNRIGGSTPGTIRSHHPTGSTHTRSACAKDDMCACMCEIRQLIYQSPRGKEEGIGGGADFCPAHYAPRSFNL